MYNKIYSLEQLYSFYMEYVARIVIANSSLEEKYHTINYVLNGENKSFTFEYNKHKILDFPEWLDFDYLEKTYWYGEKRFYSEKDKELHLLRRNNC